MSEEVEKYKRFWVTDDGVGGYEVSEIPLVDHWGIVRPVIEYEALNHMSNRHAMLQSELLAFKEEAEVLRQYGNKDCIAMADEELARRRNKNND